MLIEPITFQTCGEAAHVLGCAFADEAVSIAIYKGHDPEERIRHLTADFAIEMEDCIRRGIPLQISEAGKIVAAATIYPPGAYPFPWIYQARLLFYGILDFGRVNVCALLKWQHEAAKIHPKELHYYFQYLGVLPEYQGRGYGTAMMRHFTTLADQAHMPGYLETASAGAVPMYRRNGFETLLEKEIVGVKAWFMWRKPVKISER